MANGTGNARQEFDYRSRFGRMRARGAPERGSECPRGPAGSRRSGRRARDQFARRFSPAVQDQVRLGLCELTQRNGVRCSAASAYLHPAREWANLEVLTDTLVVGLRLDGRRAIGVSIYRHGQTETFFSEREIILAAGAYGSPQILMLLGIGPADELNSFSIPVVVDLPVGTNLQDHPLLPMSRTGRNQTTLDLRRIRETGAVMPDSG